MKRNLCYLLVLLALGLGACGQSQPAAQSPATSSDTDPRIAQIKQDISKSTTPQSKAIIDKALAIKPVVNQRPSGKTLGDMANDYATNKGTFNILPIGWDAKPRKGSDWWNITFYYRDYKKNYLTAVWEYNEKTNELYPWDAQNAAGFWVPGDAPAGTASPVAEKKSK